MNSTGIYVVIVAAAALLVAVAIFLMSRSLFGRAAPKVVEKDREGEGNAVRAAFPLIRRQLVRMMRADRVVREGETTPELEKPVPEKPAAGLEPETEVGAGPVEPAAVGNEAMAGSPLSNETVDSDPPSLSPEESLTTLLGEVATAEEREEAEAAVEVEAETEELENQPGDSLDIFKLEMVDDTGLTRIAQSLENEDIHHLVELVRDISSELGLDRE